MVRFVFASLGALTLALVALTGCEKDKPVCMQGQMYDEATGQCMASQPMCPQGTMWNGMQCAPMGGGGTNCPAGTQWNGQTCAAAGGGVGGVGGAGGGIPGLGGGSCPPAQALDAMAGMAATQGLNLLAQQNAPGAKAVGSPLAGNFQAGQCLEVQVTLNPGKCYTAIATGAGPTEVDVQLQLPLPPPGNQTIAQDNASGPMAVLGKSPDCFKNPSPFPAPMKLVLKVPAGQGMAAAQLYEK
jgi:hypothetical protein